MQQKVLALAIASLCCLASCDNHSTPSKVVPDAAVAPPALNTQGAARPSNQETATAFNVDSATTHAIDQTQNTSPLAKNAALDAIIAALPRGQRASEPERGYWKGLGFSTEFTEGLAAVRIRYASTESKFLDPTTESGFGVIKEDQATTLVVIDAGAQADGLMKTLTDAMATRGYQAQVHNLEHTVEDKDGELITTRDPISSWALPKGAVYLAREDNLVLYSNESDKGGASTTSFGAQQIFLFKDRWQSR